MVDYQLMSEEVIFPHTLFYIVNYFLLRHGFQCFYPVNFSRLFHPTVCYAVTVLVEYFLVPSVFLHIHHCWNFYLRSVSLQSKPIFRCLPQKYFFVFSQFPSSIHSIFSSAYGISPSVPRYFSSIHKYFPSIHSIFPCVHSISTSLHR